MAGGKSNYMIIWKTVSVPKKKNVLTKCCSRMLVVALFIIDKTWRQPKCPRLVGVHTKCDVPTGDNLTTHATTWKSLKKHYDE